jgi:hypothetical protein
LRLSRTPTGTDTYPADAVLASLDIDFLRDSLGSPVRDSK